MNAMLRHALGACLLSGRDGDARPVPRLTVDRDHTSTEWYLGTTHTKYQRRDVLQLRTTVRSGGPGPRDPAP